MPTHTQRISAILLALLLAAMPGVLLARAQPEDIIAPNPLLHTGVLENGLSYFVQTNHIPEGRAELRLAIRSGSLQEEDDQQGLAHFAEHMLFNGTERYPKNELIDALEHLGMDFGPEINAYTSFTETIYQLFVRTDEWDQFELALDVLEQWAAHATFTDEEIEKERGVVYEEYRLGRGADERIFDQIFPVLFHGSRYAERLPIGLPEIILNAPPQRIRDYYHEWYRPDLMGIIAVGDFDSNKVVALIQEKFSGLRNPENPKKHESYPVPSHNETLISIAHDPEATNASVEIYTKFKPPRLRYRPDYIHMLTEQVIHEMINKRMAEIVRRENPPFLYGHSFTASWAESSSLNGLVAGTSVDGTLKGIEALLMEIERAQRYGFTEGELERAKINMLKTYESVWRDQDNLESSMFVEPLVDAFLDETPYPSIDWEWEAMQFLMPKVTLDVVSTMLDERLTDENRVVVITGPSVPAITDLTEAQIRMTLNRVESMDLEPWTDKVIDNPLVSQLPEAGKVMDSKRVAHTNIDIWTLSNGATVVIKPTDFSDDEILFHAWSPGGISKVEDNQYVSGQLAAIAVAQGGLGEFSADALAKALAGKNVSLRYYIENLSEEFGGKTTPESLETLLQLHYLTVVAPRRDEVAWNSYIQRLSDFLLNRESDPQIQYDDVFWATLYDNHPRARPLKSEHLTEAKLNDALAIFTERFNGAADFTYFFVGAFEPEKLKMLVEQWIGSLPPGRSGEKWIDREIHYTATSGRTAVSAGIEPLSIVKQVWTGDWDGSWQERYYIQSLTAALEMKLLRVIREEYAGTYSIRVRPTIEIAPTPTFRIVVQFSCDPDRVEELTDKVQEEIAEFRNSLPDEKYSHDVAESQQRSLRENLKRNSWWLDQMVFAVKSETDPQTMMNRSALYETLSVEILQRAANDYFDDSRYMEIILFPEERKQ